jgi:hypothetical protein
MKQKKIRMPRRHKNEYYHYDSPQVRKADKYAMYLNVEWGMKTYNMTAEQLYYTFGRYCKDDIIWWNYIRWKELGITPNMSEEFSKYWNLIHKNENLPFIL